MKIKIKKGWEGEGREGKRLGPDIYVEQNWTPVLFDNEEDPTFFKSAGLEESPFTQQAAERNSDNSKFAIIGIDIGSKLDDAIV